MTQIINNQLAKYGYEVIALPKSNISPLLLLYKQKDHLRIYDGKLTDLFEPDASGLPVRKTTTVDFSGEQLLSTEASAGIELMSGLFSAANLNDSKLAAKLGSVNGLKLSFSYKGIQEERVRPIDLDNFILGAIPRKEGFERSLERLKNSELYVIVSVLKSADFFVEFSVERERQAQLDLALQEAGSLGAQIERRSTDSLSIRPPDDKPLAFAFRAARILYDKQQWFEFWNKKEAGFRIKDQQGLVMKGLEDFPISLLETEEGVSRF